MNKAEATRNAILQTAFQLIYHQGYQTTSIENIIQKTNLTKGAFFYHFKNKDEMGMAVMEEILFPRMEQFLIHPLQFASDPVTDIYQAMKRTILSPEFEIPCGCPLMNLVDEMATVHPAFKAELEKFMDAWQTALQKLLKRGISAGIIRKGIHPNRVALFIISGYSGVRSLGKISGYAGYKTYLKELKVYLKTLE